MMHQDAPGGASVPPAATIAAVRHATLVIAILVGPGCGGEPGVPRAEHEALLQRLDAMDRRLDAIEGAIGDASGARPAPDPWAVLPPGDALAPPSPTPDDGREPPTLAVRITLGGLELDGKPIAREDARARFREVARTAPRTRLTVLADPGVPYDTVVDALDLAREAGLTDIAMSARIHPS
jgi:hypothetical protein